MVSLQAVSEGWGIFWHRYTGLLKILREIITGEMKYLVKEKVLQICSIILKYDKTITDKMF